MPVHDFTSERLFVEGALSAGAQIACSAEQANYLLNVLRLKGGDTILVFNGRDGEWRARIADVRKRACVLEAEALVREQTTGPDIHYLFAPLKRARLDYMVQKATEMGVAKLIPVLTRHTVAERVNLERMRANAIEAAEQCGVLNVPDVAEPAKLGAVLAGWDARRPLIFCDESAEIGEPDRSLARAARKVAAGRAVTRRRDRSRRRLCRRGARGADREAVHGRDLARSQDHACGHGGRRRAGARQCRPRGLALIISPPRRTIGKSRRSKSRFH